MTLIIRNLLFFFSTALSTVLAQTPPMVEIGLIRHSGNGCPSGSMGTVLSPDKQSLSLLFDRFIAESDHHAEKRNCTLEIDFRYPQGWQFSVVTVDYRGFAALDDKTWGKQSSHYRFLPGGKALMPSQLRLRGPLMLDYYQRDENGVVPRGYSKCGSSAQLRIDTDIQVGGPKGARALMAVDSLDKVVQQSYRLNWRSCR